MLFEDGTTEIADDNNGGGKVFKHFEAKTVDLFEEEGEAEEEEDGEKMKMKASKFQMFEAGCDDLFGSDEENG